MWAVAVVLWVLALARVASGAEAATPPAESFQVSWSQLLMLFGVGAAWGDMRQQLKGVREKQASFDKRLASLEAWIRGEEE